MRDGHKLANEKPLLFQLTVYSWGLFIIVLPIPRFGLEICVPLLCAPNLPMTFAIPDLSQTAILLLFPNKAILLVK